ncbi:MAG: ANTAR domain-containing response regulator [Cellvibrionaceae bacterium]
MSVFSRRQSLNKAQSVLLLDSDPERRLALERGLMDSDYSLVKKLIDAARLLQQIQSHQPDVLVVGIDAPDAVILQQLRLIHDTCPLPVVMFAEKEAPKLIKTIVKAGVNGFVVNDIQPHRIRPIIDIATARFYEAQNLRGELEQAKTQLEGRKVIDRAKGLLMEHRNMTEDEAYRALRKMAMDKGKPLAEVAETLIDVLAMLK